MGTDGKFLGFIRSRFVFIGEFVNRQFIDLQVRGLCMNQLALCRQASDQDLAKASQKITNMYKALREIVKNRGGFLTENELLVELQKTVPLNKPEDVDNFYRCMAHLGDDPDVSVFYAWRNRLKEGKDV